MKPKLLLPPAAALIVAGVWLGSQRHSISALEKETHLLRQHVDAAIHASPAEDDPSLAAARARGGNSPDPDAIDWKDLAETMAKAERDDIPDMRALMKLQAKLMDLSGPELIAALDEIAALDLDREARRSLENMLVGLLAQKEPQIVLDRYLGKLQEPQSSMSWQLAQAFQQWNSKDSAAAIAWFDAQIAAGKFDSKSLDGKNQARLQFEAAVVHSLMADDPAAAGKRIEALPEDQRHELFQQGMLMNLKPGSEKNFAALIREHVPENERDQAFSSITNMLTRQGGFEKVSGFLNDIEATPAERQFIASQAVRSQLRNANQGTIDRAALDEMRGWIGRESPDSVDTITGESLGSLWGRGAKWEDNARLIGELHAEGAGDELLVSFLKNHQATLNREAAMELAGKIADETQRAEIIARLEGKPVRTEVIAE